MKSNNKKTKTDNIVLNELERLSKIENNDLFASELDKFIEKSKRNEFYDVDGVVWKSLDDEGFPNVLMGSNIEFKYICGKTIQIKKDDFYNYYYIRPYYKSKSKFLSVKILKNKYFGDYNGWVNLSIINDGYSKYSCNTELGIIKNNKTGDILGTSKDYISVLLNNSNDNKDKHFLIHRIVAFIKWGIPLDDYTIDINHKNENKLDNRACNLRIGSRKENITWSKKNKSGFTNIIQLKNGKYIYIIKKYGFKTEEEAYEWRCWSMPIANIEDLKEGFREPINRDKEWVSLAFLGFPDYIINQKGEIFSISKNKIIYNLNNFIKRKIRDDKYYHMVCIYDTRNKPKHFFIHVLLAKCFIFNPDPEKYNKVDHDDNDGLNNNLENLQWTIHRHNITKDCKRECKYPNIHKYNKKHKNPKFLVKYYSNTFNTPEEAQEDMKRVYKLLGLEYVDRNELRANEEIPE